MAAVQMSTSQCAFEKPSQGEMNAFDKLVQDMSDALGPSSGLDSDDVDPMDIQRLMEGYVSNSDDWHQFALSDSSRGYTRNLVDEGNGKSNLVRKNNPHEVNSPLISSSCSSSGHQAKEV